MTAVQKPISFNLQLSASDRREAAKLKKDAASMGLKIDAEAEALKSVEDSAKTNLRKLRHPETKGPVRHSVTRSARAVTVKAYIEDQHSSIVEKALGI